MGAQWDESKHPRASDGRFGSKPGEHGSMPVTKTGTPITPEDIERSKRDEQYYRDIKSQLSPANKKLFTELVNSDGQRTASRSQDKEATERKIAESLRQYRAEQAQRIQKLKEEAKSIFGSLDSMKIEFQLHGVESSNEVIRFLSAAVEWRSPYPQRAAIDHAVAQLRDAGIRMEQRGGNYSWYSSAPSGEKIRVADHLGKDVPGHEVQVVSPISRAELQEQVDDILTAIRR